MKTMSKPQLAEKTGTGQKITPKRIIFISVLGLLVVYIGWVLVPFDETIQVYDEVGLSETQKQELVDFAKSIDSFPESTVDKLKLESFLTPWSRGTLFIAITGSQSEAEVQAGFYGGPLYGGGTIFTAKWINGAWIFEHNRGLMWVS